MWSLLKGSKANLVIRLGQMYITQHCLQDFTWEPVPHFLEDNRQLHRLDRLIAICNNVVAEESSKEYLMVVPSRGIWGTAGIDGLKVDRWVCIVSKGYARLFEARVLGTLAGCAKTDMHTGTLPRSL